MDIQLILKANELQQRMQEIEERLGVVNQQIVELNSFGDDLSEISNSGSKEILASLGKGVFVKSEMKDRKFFVDVGSGVFVRKSPEETKGIISGQLERMKQLQEEIWGQREEINQELRELSGEIESKSS